jgi:hypothetical protein
MKTGKIQIRHSRFAQWFRQKSALLRQKQIYFAVGHSLALLIVCYFLWNSPFTFSDESGFIRKFYAVKKIFTGSHPAPDDVLLINVAYDKQLIDYQDEMGIPAGNIDITDRSKLTELFAFLSNNMDYKYIVCDIFFDSFLKSAADDSLYLLIAALPRIVVPMHETGNPLPEKIRHKAAYADYKTNVIEDALLKYQYLQHNQPSVPLFMWQELTGRKFGKRCFWYVMNGRLATNSVILDFFTEMQGTYNQASEKNYLNLGADLLDLIRNETSAIFKNKIILIGDLTEHDIHSTTDGLMPGVLVNYNAFRMLMENRPITSVFLWVMLFAVFFAATMMIFTTKKITDLIPRNGILKSDFVQFVLSVVEFSLILLVVNIICYFVWGRFIEIFLWSGYFAILKIIFDLYKLFCNGKENR